MGWYKNFVVVVFVVVMDGGSGGALPPRTPCWPPEICWPAENLERFAFRMLPESSLGGGALPPRTPLLAGLRPAQFIDYFGRPPAGGNSWALQAGLRPAETLG